MSPYSFIKNRNHLKIKVLLIFFLLILLLIVSNKTAFAQIDGESQNDNKDYPTNVSTTSTSTAPTSTTPNKCPFKISEPIRSTLACYILPLMGKLISLAVKFFTWAIEPTSTRNILSSTSLYLAWKNVRDFLNIAFILFLLFSAFCTIFQISKFSYKSTLLNLILMALLVNFSYPISRFIIDVSNVMMYTLLSGLFEGNSIDTLIKIAQETRVKEITTAANGNKDTVELIFIIIFLFIFAVTILIMAVLFVIRTIFLSILIIFSPVAFTGSIIPGLREQASKWWSQLFNQSFFGPAMVFMLYIAVTLMGGISAEMQSKITETNFISDLCIFMPPIIILWVGMITAKQMGAVGANSVVGFAEGKLKGMGKWMIKAPFKGAWWGFKKTGVPGGAKQRWDKFKKDGFFGSDAVAAREARRADFFGVEGAKNEHLRKKTTEILKDWKENGAPKEDDLRDLLKKGGIKGRAAAMRLAQDGKLTSIDYGETLGLLKEDMSATNMFNEEVKKKQRDLIIRSEVERGNSTIQAELAKLKDSDFGSINFENLNKFDSSGVDKYFASISNDNQKKVNIGKNISGDNKKVLEKHLLQAKKQK